MDHRLVSEKLSSIIRRLAGQKEVRVGNRLLRTTRGGKIIESKDGGRTWQVNTDFGRQCQVLGLYQEGDYLYTEIGFRDYAYRLMSNDGTHWKAIG